jgi:hypothetical protein
VAQVAQVLTAVRAIDREVADQILDGLVLALGARRAGAPGQPGRIRGRCCGHRRRICR